LRNGSSSATWCWSARPEQDEQVDALVVRDIDRTDTTVRVTLRVDGREASSRSIP
jgi:hypothetical protein